MDGLVHRLWVREAVSAQPSGVEFSAEDAAIAIFSKTTTMKDFLEYKISLQETNARGWTPWAAHISLALEFTIRGYKIKTEDFKQSEWGYKYEQIKFSIDQHFEEQDESNVHTSSSVVSRVLNQLYNVGRTDSAHTLVKYGTRVPWCDIFPSLIDLAALQHVRPTAIGIDPIFTIFEGELGEYRTVPWAALDGEAGLGIGTSISGIDARELRQTYKEAMKDTVEESIDVVTTLTELAPLLTKAFTMPRTDLGRRVTAIADHTFAALRAQSKSATEATVLEAMSRARPVVGSEERGNARLRPVRASKDDAANAPASIRPALKRPMSIAADQATPQASKSAILEESSNREPLKSSEKRQKRVSWDIAATTPSDIAAGLVASRNSKKLTQAQEGTEQPVDNSNRKLRSSRRAGSH
ncbi:hypothetical protein HJFPF1_12013 [Paramyrothecium foliicola]|nr:hypothetical protein HJFPF1_12013 [Paramyrothecium foliicola]